MRQISSIHTLKIICAFAVVLIHSHMVFKSYFMPLCRMAVPLFFIISGYFIVDNNGLLDATKLKKTLKRIIQITIIASSIYILYYIISGEFENRMHYSNIKWWILELLTGWCICGHLWYLTAYIESLICLLFIHKFNLYKVLYLFIPILFILQIFIGSYSIFFNYKIPWNVAHTNFLLPGLLCIALGMYIKTHEESLKNLFTTKHSIIILIIAYFEGLFVISHNKYYIGVGDIFLLTIPAAIAIFIFCLKHPFIDRDISHLSKHTLNIYLYHYLIIYIYVDLIPFNYTLIEAPIVFIITLGISYLYYYIQGKINSCLYAQKR